MKRVDGLASGVFDASNLSASKRATQQLCAVTAIDDLIKALETLFVPKIRFDNNGDEVRLGPVALRCGLRGRRVRPYRETDESSTPNLG